MVANREEKILIVADESLRSIADSFWKAAVELDNEVLLIEMLPRSSHGEDPLVRSQT